MPISYLEFKINKEIAYEDTFENDKKIREQYDEYIKQTERKEKKMLEKDIFFNVYRMIVKTLKHLHIAGKVLLSRKI